MDLGTIGALLGSAAYFTHLAVNGLTLVHPGRKSWSAWLAGIVVGILMTLLLSLATMGSKIEWTPQTYAQIVLVGLAAGGGAAGAALTQTSAEALRKDAKAKSAHRAGTAAGQPRVADSTQSEPDAMTPLPQEPAPGSLNGQGAAPPATAIAG